jgi:hypothetical protein
VDVDLHRTGGAGLTGAAAGGAFGTPRALLHDVPNAIRFREFGGDLQDASSAVANRLAQHAGGTEALADQHASFRANEAVSKDVANELKPLSNALRKSGAISQDADNALSRAQAGEPLNKQDLAAVRSTGDPDVISLVKQATVLSRLREHGNYDRSAETFGGGVSQAPGVRTLVNHPGYSAAAAFGSANFLPYAGIDVLTHLGGAMPTIAAALAAAKGAGLLARGVDNATGRRSPTETFARKFADPNASVRPAPAPPVASTAPVAPAPGPWGPVPPVGPTGPQVAQPQPAPRKIPTSGLSSILSATVQQMNRATRAQAKAHAQAQKQQAPAAAPPPAPSVQDIPSFLPQRSTPEDIPAFLPSRQAPVEAPSPIVVAKALTKANGSANGKTNGATPPNADAAAAKLAGMLSERAAAKPAPEAPKETVSSFTPPEPRKVKSDAGVEIELRRHSAGGFVNARQASEHIADNLIKTRSESSLKRLMPEGRENFVDFISNIIEGKDIDAQKLSRLTGIDEDHMIEHMRSTMTRAQAEETRRMLTQHSPDEAKAIAGVLNDKRIRLLWKK